MFKGKLFEEGQKVQIVPVGELRRLRDEEDIDIVTEMFQYGGKVATIKRVLPQSEWWCKDIPEYELDVDGEYWTWYNETLRPIE